MKQFVFFMLAMLLMISCPCSQGQNGGIDGRSDDAAESQSQVPLGVNVVLVDGSMVVGYITEADTSLPFTLQYGGKLSLPLNAVSSIKFNRAGENAEISFTNGDLLTGTVDKETIAVATTIGEIEIPFSSVKIFKIKGPVLSKGGGLTYWSTLDSPEAIWNPMVGSTGTYIEGEFVEGKVGRAFATLGKPEAMTVILSEGTLGASGCIEFWARLPGPPQCFGSGSHPRFFGLHTKDVGFLLEFSSNNGLGYGGLCTLFGGNACGSYSLDKAYITEYSAILGSDTTGWHHYAVAWNSAGIVSSNPQASGNALAIFVDGKVNSTLPVSAKTEVFRKLENERGALVIASHRHARFFQFPFEIDELKIWNYDKTEFELVAQQAP